MTLKDTFLSSGTVEEVGANEPFSLRDCSDAWWIGEGGGDLFVQKKLDPEKWGPRFFVCSFSPGEMISGFSINQDAPQIEWLIVPRNNSKLHRVEKTRLDPAEFRFALERMIEGVTKGLRLEPHPDDTGNLSIGKETTLAAGDVSGPLEGVVWNSVISGSAHPPALPGFVLTRESPPFPASSDTFLTAVEETRLMGESQDPNSFESGSNLFFHYASLRLDSLLEKRESESQDRIELRTKADEGSFEETLANLAGTFVQNDVSISTGFQLRKPLLAACQAVGNEAGIRIEPNLQSLERPSRQNPLERISRLCRFRYREVSLSGMWYKKEGGPLLAFEKDGEHPVALLPARGGTYEVHKPLEKSSRPVTAGVAGELFGTAYTFYRPLPDDAVGLLKLGRFTLRKQWGGIVGIVTIALTAALLGLALPIAMGQLTSELIPAGEKNGIVILVLLLLALNLGNIGLGFVRGLVTLRLETKTSYDLQAAVLDRLLALPATFFRKFQAGDLARRALGIESIRTFLSQTVVNTMLNGLFSVVYLGQILYYSPTVAMWAVLLTLVSTGITVLASYLNLKHQRQVLESSGKSSALNLQILTGMQKIRVSGSENRFFGNWADLFRKNCASMLSSQKVQINSSVILGMITPIGTGILFYLFTNPESEDLKFGVYFAVTAAYGAFFGAFTSLANSFVPLMEIQPTYKRFLPILEEAPENLEDKRDPGVLSGSIHVSRVSFQYGEDTPVVLSEVDLRVNQGEFIAVVGSSGSGKSTLLRLLLGLEKPTYGDVLYEGQSMQDLDLQEIRRQIGVVLQDGKILPGSIMENIRGSSMMTMDEVMETAKLAGLDQDIEQMPMKLFTMVSDTTLSGGQRQRLLIARALAHRPKILFFDEATSALDNRTQAMVSKNIEQLKATRIVIAHRLSTIINADRIYVMEQGKLVQSGNFEELMKVEGIFKDLASRQIA